MVISPTRDIALIYGLGNYVLPLMIVCSWILTVSLLRPYVERIGKRTFWLIVTIPLIYQLFTFIVRDANLISDPSLTEVIYSKPFQFLFAISVSSNRPSLCYRISDNWKKNETKSHERLFNHLFYRYKFAI